MAYTVLESTKGQKKPIFCPIWVDDGLINLPPNAVKVLEKRYLRKDLDGSLLETPAGMFYRVARSIAQAEEDPEAKESATRAFYNLMTERRFYPNSPTFTGAGTPLGQLAACFVLGIEDDMGKDDQGIFSTLRTAALIQQTGGGNGFSFSKLRPKGDVVHASSGKASGPVGFLRVYDAAFGEIAQGGTRRGANMAVLRVDHPDIEEFITCKAKEGAISNFNISVAITDEFMQAVETDKDFDLRNPRDGKVWKTIKARELFDKIVEYAHRNGEPGVLFIDAANRSNPVPHLYQLEATNPCGEQWLGPYENCCLGSINLAVHVMEENGVPKVYWNLLQRSVYESVRFLDDVVTINSYVPAIPQIKEAALRARRIGLGIMGLGDLFYKLGISYGSLESQVLAEQIMEFVRYHAMNISIHLAKNRGAFPALKGSIYDPTRSNGMSWKPPQRRFADDPQWSSRWERPSIDWGSIEEGIAKHGIRNAAQTTIAPTGTIATVCGCEGYGCEPVFALGYVRHFKDGDKDVELAYTSPLFEEALGKLQGISDQRKEEIRRHVANSGTCQDIPDLPEYIRNTFVVSGDLTADQHVEMQAALQTFVDNSLSKTINFPKGATLEDVAKAYVMAWQLGCKGLTVYVTGSRDQVVLETKGAKIAPVKHDTIDTINMHPIPVKRPRPARLQGTTYRKNTPLGHAYITINSDQDREPFEAFLNVGKAGSETSAVSEAMGRLISLILRMPSQIQPNERLGWIVDELSGIGGGRPMGFGNHRVRSLPDGIAQVLSEHLSVQVDPVEDREDAHSGSIGDICPECGEATFLNVEGCRKCASCGYSEC